ncbi:MAG: hypothetical protein IID38_06730 [Planctomycetes bacterium]|nr:hypothetical protein [Planctomycetota bacterium]
MTVRDLTGQSLVVELTAYDHAMRPAAQTRQVFAVGAPRDWSWEPDLPGYGWYLLDMKVRDLDQAQKTTRTPVARTFGAVLWLPPGGNLHAMDAHRFQLIASGLLNNQFRFLSELLEATGIRSTVVSVWEPQTTLGDIETMRSKIENEEFRRRRLQGEEATPDSGPFFTLAGVLTAAGARRDPNARAHIAAAQRIYLYAIGFEGGIPGETEPSLMFEHTLEDISTVDAPELEEIWQAQVNYWIQKDVVEAIVAINEQAAAEAKKRNEDRWVGIMPVKDFISLRMSDGYVEPSEDDYAGAPPGGYKPALPAASPSTVFTHSASTDFYDVMQFTLKLVMDQRDVPRLIERLCANSFHTPLRFAYEAVMPNRAMKGKVYGAEPSVNVVMDFEIVMLGEIFRKWMPAVVCEEYGIRCPIRDDAEADTEEG